MNLAGLTGSFDFSLFADARCSGDGPIAAVPADATTCLIDSYFLIGCLGAGGPKYLLTSFVKAR
jgi:hypothetical protein